MVHAHVVNMIRIAKVTKEGTNHPEQISVDELISFKQFSVAKTMQHEAKGSFKIKL